MSLRKTVNLPFSRTWPEQLLVVAKSGERETGRTPTPTLPLARAKPELESSTKSGHVEERFHAFKHCLHRSAGARPELLPPPLLLRPVQGTSGHTRARHSLGTQAARQRPKRRGCGDLTAGAEGAGGRCAWTLSHTPEDAPALQQSAGDGRAALPAPLLPGKGQQSWEIHGPRGSFGRPLTLPLLHTSYTRAMDGGFSGAAALPRDASSPLSVCHRQL